MGPGRTSGPPVQSASKPSTTKAVLQKRLSPDEYQEFITSMFFFGLTIARASGGGMFGTGDPVSDDEKRGLAAVGAFYELDIDRLRRLSG